MFIDHGKIADPVCEERRELAEEKFEQGLLGDLNKCAACQRVKLTVALLRHQVADRLDETADVHLDLVGCSGLLRRLGGRPLGLNWPLLVLDRGEFDPLPDLGSGMPLVNVSEEFYAL